MEDQKVATRRETEAVIDKDCVACDNMKEDVPRRFEGLEKAELKYTDFFSDRGKEIEREAGESFKGTPFIKDCLVYEDGTKSCRTVTGYNKDKSFAKMSKDNYLRDLEVDEV